MMDIPDPVEAGADSFPASDPPAWSASGRTDHAEGLVWPFALPALRFGYGDLEPILDEPTLRLHHDRHHRTYVETLNKLLANHPDCHGQSIEALLGNLASVPTPIREAVRNHGGGHANHQFFWKILRSARDAGPSGALAAAIDRAFGSFETFKSEFEQAGLRHFGSGWVFLVVRPKDQFRLEILSLPNQDSVLSLAEPAQGLLLCDLWEHAYYLKHQNRRAEWLSSWWPLVDWDAVADRYAHARAGRSEL